MLDAGKSSHKQASLNWLSLIEVRSSEVRMSHELKSQTQANGLSFPTVPTLKAEQARGTQARLLYSYQEAREQLGGVPVSTFALWIAKGLIEPVRIGPRRCFIRHEDLIRLASGEVELPKAG
ncbi:hypothetical protein [Geothrix limicola]|uniref:hypothetical protein n=1 Tax=Geothrix limicola TaxID=2927978 RepID=UPI002554C1B9|nr:hypothetical protein [Geothrix limicola]